MVGPDDVEFRKRRAREAEQGNAGRAEKEGGPHPQHRPRPLVGGDHEPQEQQRRRYRGGADHGGEGFKQQHRTNAWAARAGGYVEIQPNSSTCFSTIFPEGTPQAPDFSPQGVGGIWFPFLAKMEPGSVAPRTRLMAKCCLWSPCHCATGNPP